MKVAKNLSALPFISHGFYNALDTKEVEDPILMNQVHSVDTAYLMTKPFVAPQVDALITKTKGLNLTVKTADCGPILIADPITHMIAAIHAGWRGAFQGIIESTVLEMVRKGAKVQDMVAAIGPHIQCNSFEIGLETQRLFPITENKFFITNQNHIYFDFDAYLIHRLKRTGIENIESIGDDTYSDKNYNSFRRDQTKERQYSTIMIKE